MPPRIKSLFAAAIITVAIALPLKISAEKKSMPEQISAASVRLPVEGEFPSLSGALEWLNSKPLTPGGLRGKVVAIDFWTYTCVNWSRTLPYVRAWAHKYKNEGLVVIGVHTPEFGFEANVDNVRRALKEMDIDYPVAIDSRYAIWNAFYNEYWPALYLIDAQGRIRYHYFGEGAYDQSERAIQQLLAESGERNVSHGLVSVDPRGLEVAADLDNLRSGETYLGYGRTENFASPAGIVSDMRHTYTLPARLGLNEWALSGDWTITKEAVALHTANGRIAYRFHARDVNLIASPSKLGSPIKFRVFVDGKPPGAAHGTDVDANGYGTILEQGTYQLIRQPKPIVDRTFEIEFPEPGVEAFDFTFG